MAYIDEVEQTSKDRSNSRSNPKLYYSTLVKALPTKFDSQDPIQNLDQVKFFKYKILMNGEHLTFFYAYNKAGSMNVTAKEILTLI